MNALDIYRVVKKPFFGRYQKPWHWPAQTERDGWTTVRFPGDRGVKLAGTYAQAHALPAKATILCGHPMGTDAKGFFLKRGHADVLRRNGYNVFLFDFNGFGESESGSFEYPDDVLSGARAARSVWPNTALGFLGISFGASWGICALSRESSLFRAAILESAFTTLDEYWRRYPLPYMTLKCLNLCMPDAANRLRPISRIAEARDARLLLIYGAKDTVTPIEMGQRFLLLAGGATPERTMWIVDGAEHTKALQSAPQEYETRAISFLDAAFA
jgi:pimeloyl-ACP methyl ester carboxylesterase